MCQQSKLISESLTFVDLVFFCISVRENNDASENLKRAAAASVRLSLACGTQNNEPSSGDNDSCLYRYQRRITSSTMCLFRHPVVCVLHLNGHHGTDAADDCL